MGYMWQVGPPTTEMGDGVIVSGKASPNQRHPTWDFWGEKKIEKVKGKGRTF